MNDEINKILDDLRNKDCYVNNETILTFDEASLLLDYITNLQKEVRVNNDLIPHFKNRVKELKKEITNLQEENERLKAQLTDIEWEYQNTRCKYEKQYKKGTTEELIEDIEECFFNKENPSMIPIDSLDVCHIFGYIDYLKDYKSRIEKVDEYIKDIFKDEKWYENYEYNDLENVLKNVLNILQNGSENNESN